VRAMLLDKLRDLADHMRNQQEPGAPTGLPIAGS